jgi:uncharacterized protein involved in exopolysaccharide biosynthesis
VILHKVVGAVSRHKRLASFVFFAVFIASLLACLFVAPRYESATLLLVGQATKEPLSEGSSNEFRDQIVSLVQIARTDVVLLEAAKKVGLSRLNPKLIWNENDADGPRHDAEIAALLAHLDKSIGAIVEPRSNLLRISYRNTDPVVAAEFVNRLADSLISRQAQLINQPEALGVFQEQQRKLEAEVQRTSADLTAFATRTAIYSVANQRELLLRRASELASALASTRVLLAEREGQRQALVDQLKKLKPVAQSPFVSGVVESLGATDGGGPTAPVSSPKPESRGSPSDPPLLLVRVYQDGMATLMKISMEIAGYNSLQASQASGLDKVNEELKVLSEKEAEYSRLKRDRDLASTTAETYGKRIIDERISLELAKAKLSSIRVAQRANVPVEAIFPRPIMFLPLGILVGVLAAVSAAIIVTEWNQPKPRNVIWPRVANFNFPEAIPEKSSVLMSGQHRLSEKGNIAFERSHLRRPDVLLEDGVLVRFSPGSRRSA